MLGEIYVPFWVPITLIEAELLVVDPHPFVFLGILGLKPGLRYLDLVAYGLYLCEHRSKSCWPQFNLRSYCCFWGKFDVLWSVAV